MTLLVNLYVLGSMFFQYCITSLVNQLKINANCLKDSRQNVCLYSEESPVKVDY